MILDLSGQKLVQKVHSIFAIQCMLEIGSYFPKNSVAPQSRKSFKVRVHAPKWPTASFVKRAHIRSSINSIIPSLIVPNMTSVSSKTACKISAEMNSHSSESLYPTPMPEPEPKPEPEPLPWWAITILKIHNNGKKNILIEYLTLQAP